MKKRFNKSRRAAEKVAGILDRLSGRINEKLDRRSRSRGHRDNARRLSIDGNEELFRRLVLEDFEYLKGLRFAIDEPTRRILLPQSVAGRAHNGHGFFIDEFGSPLIFPDATFDRVLAVLVTAWPDMRNDSVRRARNAVIDRVRRLVEAQIDDTTMMLSDEDGPLLGVDFLAGRQVDSVAFLKGMVLAGYMDDFRQRQMTMSWHRLTWAGRRYNVGGGDIRIVDPERMAQVGIDDPGRVPFEDDEIRTLKDLGVLMSDDDSRLWSFPDYDQAFFRRRAGEGVCDDLALIRIGAEHGLDGMLGAFVMDAIDTYDKFLWTFRSGGSDTALAASIQRHFRERDGEPLVPGEEILDLIYFAAKNNSPMCRLSSSHRRFIQYEKSSPVPTVLHHWRYLTGEKLHDIELGFDRVEAREFYGIVAARLESAGFKMPPARFDISS